MKKINIADLTRYEDFSKIFKQFIANEKGHSQSKSISFLNFGQEDCGKDFNYQQFLLCTARVCLTHLADNVKHLCSKVCYDKMRNFYFKKVANGSWKSEHQFNIDVLLSTEIINKFLYSTFTQMYASRKLQSEIFIIIIYVLLGIKMSANSYEVLSKKHEKKNKYKQKQDAITKNQIQNHRLQISKSFYNQNSSSLYQNRVSKIRKTILPIQPILQFQNILKQNLYVSSLPYLNKQKKSIDQHLNNKSYLNTQDLLSNQGWKKKKENKQKIESFFDFSFDSSQLSSSINAEIIKTKSSISKHYRPLKIKQKVCHFFEKSYKIQNSSSIIFTNGDEYKKQTLNNNLQVFKQSSHQWKNRIIKIRDKFNQMQQKIKCERINKNRHLDHQQQNLPSRFENSEYLKQSSKQTQTQKIPNNLFLRQLRQSNSCHHFLAPEKQQSKKQIIKTNSINTKTSTTNSERKQFNDHHQYQTIHAGVRNFRQILMTTDQNQYSSVPSNKKIKRKALLEKKKGFQSQVLKRNQRMYESTFLLPAQKFKQKKFDIFQ